MDSKKPRITQNRLRELMRYDPEEGLFWWYKTPSGRRHPISVPAGTIRKDGYRTISVEWVRYYGHQLAWLYMTGDWAEYIDHRDGNPSNNRWANLRKATHNQNMANKKRQRDNISGYKGVWLEQNNKYYCDARFDGIKIRGGPFKTPQEAHALYIKLISVLHGEFARWE